MPDTGGIRVLVVDDDVLFARTVIRQLEGLGMEADHMTTPARALAFLESAAPPVALVDLDLQDDDYDGIALIRTLRARRPQLQAVLMSAVATARDYKNAVAGGAVDVLVKPFSKTELREAIERAIACESGVHGDIHGLSLPEILQMYHFSRRAVALLFDQGGLIALREGDIVHAEVAELTGEAALARLLARSTTGVRTSVLKSETRTITRRFDTVLLDVLRGLDEQSRDAGATGDPGIDLDLDELSFGELEDDEPQPQPQSRNTNADTGDSTMGKIDDSCKQVVDNTDGGIACGVVDLDTGMLLGIFNSAQYTQSLNEIVAAAAVDMFRGANVGRIEKAVRAHRGVPEDGNHYIQEVQFSSKNNYHFCKSIKGGKAVIILVTNKNTNVGMGWAQLKSVVPSIEPLVP